jgi:hypothetical protein
MPNRSAERGTAMLSIYDGRSPFCGWMILHLQNVRRNRVFFELQVAVQPTRRQR